jgi:tyrosyl-tRNA synthetase
VTQGAVKIDQKKIEDPKLKLESQGSFVVQVGKRAFKRIILT